MNKRSYDCNRYESKSCKLAQYATEMDHSFDFENIRILEIKPNKKREVLEIIRIQDGIRNRLSINNRPDISNLPCIYKSLLQRRKITPLTFLLN